MCCSFEYDNGRMVQQLRSWALMVNTVICWTNSELQLEDEHVISVAGKLTK